MCVFSVSKYGTSNMHLYVNEKFCENDEYDSVTGIYTRQSLY